MPSFKQLAVDPWRAPERIRLRHRPNQRADIGGDGRPAGASATLPRPEQAEAAAMPGEDRLRFDDDERRSPVVPRRATATPRASGPPSRAAAAAAATVGAPAVGGAAPEPRGAARRATATNPRSVRRSEISTDIIAERAYPSMAATSTAATRTEFSAGTGLNRRLLSFLGEPAVPDWIDRASRE